MTKKINGLEEAIDFWRSGALQSQEHLKHLMVLREAARAYQQGHAGVPDAPIIEAWNKGELEYRNDATGKMETLPPPQESVDIQALKAEVDNELAEFWGTKELYATNRASVHEALTYVAATHNITKKANP